MSLALSIDSLPNRQFHLETSNPIQNTSLVFSLRSVCLSHIAHRSSDGVKLDGRLVSIHTDHPGRVVMWRRGASEQLSRSLDRQARLPLTQTLPWNDIIKYFTTPMILEEVEAGCSLCRQHTFPSKTSFITFQGAAGDRKGGILK
jgi:hypothetical protein